MRDDDDAPSLFDREAAELTGDLPADRCVEVRGRFVGDDHFRVVREGAYNGKALLFPAGELVWAVVEPVREAHVVEQGTTPVAGRAAGAARQVGSDFHVLEGVQRTELEGLEDEAEVAGAQRGQAALGCVCAKKSAPPATMPATATARL